MNALMGFDNWEKAIPDPGVKNNYRGRIAEDAMYIPQRIWHNMKSYGYRGLFEIPEIKQGHGRGKEPESVEQRLKRLESRMPLPIWLKCRENGGIGTSRIRVVIQGWGKNPNGVIVVKIDLPDFKTELDATKNVDKKAK